MAEAVTVILGRAARGDSRAISEVFAIVYAELRDLARRHLAQERSGHTLQATALVNEAFVKLSAGMAAEVRERSHFFGIASRAMRQILVDHARTRNAIKRGDGGVLQLHEGVEAPAPDAACDAGLDIEALDGALVALEEHYPRQARLVELRYFGGLSEPDAAAMLGVSLRTAAVDWAFARAWLRRRMEA